VACLNHAPPNSTSLLYRETTLEKPNKKMDISFILDQAKLSRVHLKLLITRVCGR